MEQQVFSHACRNIPSPLGPICPLFPLCCEELIRQQEWSSLTPSLDDLQDVFRQSRHGGDVTEEVEDAGSDGVERDAMSGG